MKNLRKILMILAVVAPLGAFAQRGGVVYYLDSVVVDLQKSYLSPASIRGLNIERGTPDKIYIQSCDDFKALTLAEVVKKYALLPSEADVDPIYIINGVVIKDTAGVFVDESWITDVTITKLKGADYINNPGNMAIVQITIGTDFSAGKKQPFRLRG